MRTSMAAASDTVFMAGMVMPEKEVLDLCNFQILVRFMGPVVCV